MATNLPELAIGTIDGVNQDFTTSFDYLPGTLRLWVDGIIIHGADDDGFIETGSNSFSTKIAWEPGTRLQVLYDRP